MPWTFSLFHCSSSYDGGSLTPALSFWSPDFPRRPLLLLVGHELTSGPERRNRLQFLSGTLTGAVRHFKCHQNL